MKRKTYILFLLFSFFIVKNITSQTPLKQEVLEEDTTSFKTIKKELKNGTVLEAIVTNGDTIYAYTMRPVLIGAFRPYNDKEKDKKFKRLQYHVKKIYPYAKLASDKLNKYNEELLKVKSKSKRRKLLRMREKELKGEFTDVIKKMTVNQGKILVKLIDRETGSSTYEILKEMRGGFKTFIWQGVAKLYSADLKLRYNPKVSETDEMIERIVRMIENQRAK